ncbi:hypothetical protein M8J77_013359 [Diaphorina citri]|nr:hypothetical protein M8J77_013359 [Diaphorina citri]
MKSGVDHQPFLINLDNFESQEAINSPYVLTSPRSLKACKKAGVKPVELLYRTCQEIATELGISVNHVRNIHHQQETERQRKLEMCRKMRDELKNKQTRFHFFQRKSPASKYIHKGNNAKQRPPPASIVKHRVTLTTDSDESRNSPLHYATANTGYTATPPHKYTSTLEVPMATTRRDYTENCPRGDLTKPDDCRRTEPAKVFVRPPSCNTVSASSPECYKPMSYSTPAFNPSYTVPSGRSPLCERKYSDPGVPNATRHELLPSKASAPRSLHFADSPKRPLDKYQANKSSCSIAPLTQSDTKPRKYDPSDSCASVSSLTPDLIDDTYPIKTKPADRHLNGDHSVQMRKKEEVNKDSELGNTSTTSSDKEDKKTTKRVKMKSKENRIDICRKNQSLPISFGGHDPLPNGEGAKKRIRFKKDTSVNSDSSSSASSKKTTASTGDLRKKYKTKMKQFPDLSHVPTAALSTDPESFYRHNISLQDRRILESLALKKRGEMENERRAYEAHKLWEEDRKSMDRKQEQKQKEWKCYVEKKRKLENSVNTMRMEEVKENLRQAQTLLEARLEERDKRIRDVINQTEHKKILDSFEKKENYDKKRFLVEANHLQRELERIMQYEECEHALTEKLKKAEKLRERGLRNFHKKVASANKLEELRHQERMEELLEEDKFLRSQKIKELHEREDRVIQRYMDQVRQKLQAIKRNSMDRELKSQQAKQTVRELEEGLETWQDHVMLMQWDALRRSEANAQLLLANRRLRVECENKERMLQHSRRYRERKVDEARKLRGIIDEIRNKEDKIKRLQRTREREVTECRLRAHSAAELREQIRNTLTPETFDRKVSRVNMELRVSSRPPSASPTLMRSHIRLG